MKDKNKINVTSTSKSFFWPIWLSVFLILSLFFLIFFGKYTKSVTLQGYIIPQTGVLKIYAPKTGITSKIFVKEGEKIIKGEPLFSLSSYRNNSDNIDANLLMEASINLKIANYRKEIEVVKDNFEIEKSKNNNRLLYLTQELNILKDEEAIQNNILISMNNTERRHEKLHKDGFISEIILSDKYEITNIQKSKLQTLKRSIVILEKERQTLKDELKLLEIKKQTNLFEIQKNKSLAELELINQKTQSELVIPAPESGIISTITISQGETVGNDKPLVSIISGESNLEANIFAQSKDFGFIKHRQPIKLRYKAFPYQKFGHYDAEIIEISNTPVTVGEIAYPSASIDVSASKEQYYRIKLKLDKASVEAYGEKILLRPGMQLEADVLIDTRTIFEWIMEPIYSIKGKVFHN